MGKILNPSRGISGGKSKGVRRHLAKKLGLVPLLLPGRLCIDCQAFKSGFCCSSKSTGPASPCWEPIAMKEWAPVTQWAPVSHPRPFLWQQTFTGGLSVIH